MTIRELPMVSRLLASIGAAGALTQNVPVY